MRNESIKKLFDIVRENKKVSYPGMKYHDQLKTKEWKYYRLYVWLAKKHNCELCGERLYKFHVHHKKYYKDIMAWQYDLKDVMLLCGLHHFKIHRPELVEKGKIGLKSIKQMYNGT